MDVESWTWRWLLSGSKSVTGWIWGLIFFFGLNFCTANKRDHGGCLERMSCPSWTTTKSTTMADQLFICVSQHRALFDKRDANYKHDNLKDDPWLSTQPDKINPLQDVKLPVHCCFKVGWRMTGLISARRTITLCHHNISLKSCKEMAVYY